MNDVAGRAPAKDDRHAWAEPGVEDLGGGLYRIPLPLPHDALTAVNVYAIAGDDGIDLIDAGMALTQARERLTEALAGLGYGLPDIRNFFITHIHQDHYTLAVALRTTLRTTLRTAVRATPPSPRLITARGQITLGEGERANLAAIMGVGGAGQAEPGSITMLPALGAPHLTGPIHDLFFPPGADARSRLEWEAPDHWLDDGALIELPARTLRAIHTPGHTSGHVVFHDEAAAVLFAGDHVLPHITPSIGFQPVIDRLALDQYLGSLRLLLTLPDARLLPAHGPVRDSTHARVNELLAHHETRLAQTLEVATGGPVTSFAVAAELPWTRRQRKLADLDPMNQLLAISETAAHLEVLVLRGTLTRSVSPEGADLYALTRPAA